LTPIAKGFLSKSVWKLPIMESKVFGGHDTSPITDKSKNSATLESRLSTRHDCDSRAGFAGRKFSARMAPYCSRCQRRIGQFIAANANNNYAEMLEEHVREWNALTRWIGAASARDADEVMSRGGIHPVFGLRCWAYFWPRPQ